MRKLTITFPVVEYSPPYSDGSGTTNTHLVLFQPKQLFQCGRFPLRSMYIPGGIVDATGLEVPYVDVHGVHELRPWWAFATDVAHWFHKYRVEPVFGEPKQLSLDEFRNKLIYLQMKEKGLGRNIMGVKHAKSFITALEALHGEDRVDAHAPPLTLEIEIHTSTQ